MASPNPVGYVTTATTGTIFATNASGNTIIYGYSLKGSGAVGSLDVNDNGTRVFGTEPLTAAGSLPANVFPLGITFVGPVTISGTATNLSALTIFYSRE